MDITAWISKNVTLLTLFVTAGLMIITLISTLITRKMLRLSSRPTVRIKPESISIYPPIDLKSSIGDSDDDLEGRRYCIAIEVRFTNVGDHAAQDVYIDGEVYFKKRKPLGNLSLPVHLPDFLSYLASHKGPATENRVDLNVRFDNFVAREIVRDFFQGRKNFPGTAVLPSKKEIEDPKLWPSPRIVIRCFYKDIQGQNYLSESQVFFHIWKDSEHRKLDCDLLNIQELESWGIRRISNRIRSSYIKKMRHLRYTAFSGEKHRRGDLILLKKKATFHEEQQNND